MKKKKRNEEDKENIYLWLDVNKDALINLKNCGCKNTFRILINVYC